MSCLETQAPFLYLFQDSLVHRESGHDARSPHVLQWTVQDRCLRSDVNDFCQHGKIFRIFFFVQISVFRFRHPPHGNKLFPLCFSYVNINMSTWIRITNRIVRYIVQHFIKHMTHSLNCNRMTVILSRNILLLAWSWRLFTTSSASSFSSTLSMETTSSCCSSSRDSWIISATRLPRRLASL